MALSGLYIRFVDANRRKDYPNIISFQGKYYETKTNALTAAVDTNLSELKVSTNTANLSTFNTLNAFVVNTANEDFRLYNQQVAVYAFYDL